MTFTSKCSHSGNVYQAVIARKIVRFANGDLMGSTIDKSQEPYVLITGKGFRRMVKNSFYDHIKGDPNQTLDANFWKGIKKLRFANLNNL